MSWAFSRRWESGDGGLQCWLDDSERRRHGCLVVVRNGDAKRDYSTRLGPLLQLREAVDAGDVAAETRGRKTVAVPWSGRRTRGLGTAVWTVGLAGRSHRVLIFPDFPKLGQTCKFKIDAFRCSTNSQLSQLCQLSQLACRIGVLFTTFSIVPT
jgi:hypothetical protein